MSLLKPLRNFLKVEVIDILSGEIVNNDNKEQEYENLMLKLFDNMKLNKKKIKIQYYLFEIIILLLTLMTAVLSSKEIITILAVVSNTFNLVFYILIKDVFNKQCEKVYLLSILDGFNGEVISYNISKFLI